jgi:uncharacterized protein (DUF1330 family)
MSVYFVAQISIFDQTSYNRYSAHFRDIFSRYQGTTLAVDNSPVVLEGEWEQRRVVLISFPDERSLLEWWESQEYQEIAKDRRAGSDAVILMLSGVS